MSIAHTLLGLLESGPRHGYDLKRAFDETFGHDRPLHYGQVYSTMSRLLKNGLVEVDGIEAGGGPERKRYAITDAGITDGGRWPPAPGAPPPRRGSRGRGGVPRAPGAPGAVSAVHAVHQGRPRPAHPTRRGRHPRHAALRAPADDADPHRPEAEGGPGRPAHLRPRPVPSRGRPALAGA